jgi:hypothetical protein
VLWRDILFRWSKELSVVTDEQKPEAERLGQGLLDAFAQIEADRLESLSGLRDIELISQAVLQRETERLSRKLGTDHPRVRRLETRLREKRELIRALEIELELAKIEVPEVEEDGTTVDSSEEKAA